MRKEASGEGRRPLQREALRIPRRREDSNKGSYGRLLLLAGSEGMCGAAYLSALAAYRSGAGLVRILGPESNRVVLQTLLPEAVLRCYRDPAELPGLVERECGWADFLAAGPGIGTGAEAQLLLRSVLRYGQAPLLLDADGLNLLAMEERLRESFLRYALRYPTVVTPHPMEMARLLGRRVEEITAAPERAAAAFTEQSHAITVLKGHQSLVLDERQRYQNREPSPALSKAGSGDVLSGCIAGLYEVLKAEEAASAEGRTAASSEPRTAAWKPEDAGEPAGRETASDAGRDRAGQAALLYRAACLAVSVHALAGRIAAREKGEHAVLARDTADAIGAAMETFMTEDTEE